MGPLHRVTLGCCRGLAGPTCWDLWGQMGEADTATSRLRGTGRLLSTLGQAQWGGQGGEAGGAWRADLHHLMGAPRDGGPVCSRHVSGTAVPAGWHLDMRGGAWVWVLGTGGDGHTDVCLPPEGGDADTQHGTGRIIRF